MSFNASPVAITLLTAQAAITADLLYRQTGDPMDRLVLVMLPDGTYATETVRNKTMREEAYSSNKTLVEKIAVGAAVVGAVGLVVWLVRRK